MSKHTPGPWEVKKDDDQWRIRQKGSVKRRPGFTVERPVAKVFRKSTMRYWLRLPRIYWRHWKDCWQTIRHYPTAVMQGFSASKGTRSAKLHTPLSPAPKEKGNEMDKR